MTIYSRLRDFFTFPKLPTPLWVIATDDDIQFHDDCNHLAELADNIFHAIDFNAADQPHIFEHHVARPLMEMIAIPVEPKNRPDWPDYAAVLLGYWRSEREQQRMIDEHGTAA